tara:strand:+ start:925 stop:2157 length:1233 start_codon:yes stop_codon:yes gene_type:complete
MSLIDKIVDAATSKPARGIVTGYVQAKVNDTAEQDRLNQEFILAAKDQYYNVDKPQFMADEKKRSNNIDFISTKLSPILANYADANNITLSDVNTRDFISSINDLSNEDKYKLESTIVSRKKERVQSFDDKNKFIQEQFLKMKGGPGDMNLMKVFFPNEGNDIAEVGIKQPTETTDLPMQSVMQIEGAGGNFDIMNNRHSTIASQADTDFRNFFRNDMGQPSISFANTAAQYPLLQELLKGYDEAVANDYKDGKYQYALNRYIERELNKQKVTGYPTGIPETAKKEEVVTGTTGSKSIPGDGVKFDSETYGQRKKDAPKINLASQRQMLEPTAEQKVDNPANIINESRETIAEIMEYDDVKADIVLQKAGLNQYLTSSLDEKKQALIAFNRQMAKDEIKNIGLNPDNFEL